MRAEMTGIVVPGKLYGAMASGRPTLFVGPDHCESADTVRQAECGLTLRLGDVDGLVEALTRLADDPELADADGPARPRGLPRPPREGRTAARRWNAAIADLLTDPRRRDIGPAPPCPGRLPSRGSARPGCETVVIPGSQVGPSHGGPAKR